MRISRARAWLLAEACTCALLLLGFVALKASYHPPLGDGLDGAYYLQIARHVAQGDGFVTSLSIYHMGLSDLPQAAMTYPLLPLLVGAAGKLIGVVTASELLPEALYLVSLCLCYLWVRSALAHSLPKEPRWLLVLAATSVTAWLGLNPVYHWASSRPYTESLGVTLVFCTLLAYGKVERTAFRSRGARAGAFVALGMLAGLCYLARFQLLVVAAGLALSELSQRGKKGTFDALCIGVGASVPVGGWALRFLSMPNAELRALFDFAAYRQLPTLPRFAYGVPCGTFSQCALEKVDGLFEAFHPSGKDSYVAQFGLIAFCLPIAAAWFAWSILAREGVLSSLRERRHATWLASAWIGVLSVIPIHLVHSLYWRSWAFGWRQGLPLFFLLVPASLWILARPTRWSRWLVLAAFVVSGWTLGTRTLSIPDRDAPPGWLEARAAAAAYLQRVALHERTLAIEPQPIGAFTDAPLDWLACWSPPQLAEQLIRTRGVTRVALGAEELGCPSLSRVRGSLALEQIVGPGRRMGIFRVRPTLVGVSH